MKMFRPVLFALGVLVLSAFPTAFGGEPEEAPANSVPPAWRAEWENPSAASRPLQIVHGRTIDTKQAAYYRDVCGLGGVVVSVAAENGYVRSDANWEKCAENVRQARAAGLRVWFYDELAWPSLSAGGAVLERDPSLESLELVWDADAEEPFYVRPSYEYTFASMDTLRTARRHPNPLDPKATDMFLEVTHRRFQKALGPELYDQVEAFFTDEPTLLGISLLRILTPEERKKYGEADLLDWTKKQLPAVPWRADMEERYREAYGEALRPDFASLFRGDSEKDRKVRRNFWSLIARLNADSYFGEIRRFCQSDPNGPIASGHTLCEESPILSVPLDGNKLSVLKQFQIPGQDLLNSEPAAQFRSHWITSAFPASAASFIGARKVMTEISDHVQRHAETPRVATLEEMRTTAALMASWGVTEFTLYYSISGGEEFPYRNEETHRNYCDFVGRLNAVLRDAEPVRPLLLYYPIELLQEEYLPMAGTFRSDAESPRMRDAAMSLMTIGGALCSAQIPFLLVDDETLGELAANGEAPGTGGRTVRTAADYSGILYPTGIERGAKSATAAGLPEMFAKDFPEENRAQKAAEAAASLAGPRLVFDPPANRLGLGAFVRDGRLVFLVVNASKEAYDGTARVNLPKGASFDGERFRFDGQADAPTIPVDGVWSALNPTDGGAAAISSDGGALPLRLEAGESLLLVSPK